MSQTKAQLVGGVGISTAENLVVSGITTLGDKVKVGVGTTALIVEGDVRITGILTIGTSSITLDGSSNSINVGTGITITTTEIKVGGVTIGDTGITGSSSYASTAGIATDLLGGNAGINTTSTPTNLYVSGNAASNIVGLGTTDANTTLDFSTGNNFSFELTGSIVLQNPTGVTTGQSGIILIQQDGVGSHTVGFGSHWDFPSATAPTLSTGANALDALTYFVRNSTSIVTNSLLGIGTL